MEFEVYDPEFRRLVPEESKLMHRACGFTFVEGPVWRGDHLIFSDINASRLVRFDPLLEGPEIHTFRYPSNQSNGNTLDPEGRLVTCEHETRRVSRTDLDGTVVPLATHYEGKRLNSPNDVTGRSDGSIYFTDPNYGLKNYSEGKELPFQGVYRIAPDGSLHLLVDDFDRPNGLAFSPDEQLLYIDDSARRHIRVFDVAADGSIGNSRIFADMQSPDKGSPDGMKIDVEGNIYCTGPGAIWIYTPTGKLLGRIVPAEKPANLAWGDADNRTLYITAITSLYSIRVAVPGLPVIR